MRVTADLLKVELELVQELAVPRSERRTAVGANADGVMQPDVVVVAVRGPASGSNPRCGGRDLAGRFGRILQIQKGLHELRLLGWSQLAHALSTLHGALLQ